jgi:hypothetical protein
MSLVNTIKKARNSLTINVYFSQQQNYLFSLWKWSSYMITKYYNFPITRVKLILLIFMSIKIYKFFVKQLFADFFYGKFYFWNCDKIIAWENICNCINHPHNEINVEEIVQENE